MVRNEDEVKFSTFERNIFHVVDRGNKLAPLLFFRLSNQ